MTFDMTQNNNDPRYQVHIYGWNVDDRYLFSDYASAEIMFTDLVQMYRSFKSVKPIITITDVITSERLKHER